MGVWNFGANGLANLFGSQQLSRADPHLRSLPGQKPGHALAYRSRHTQDQGGSALQLQMPAGGADRGGSRRVGATGVQQNRHA